MDDEEFANEKFGLKEKKHTRSFGLIDEPNAENTPEERARLDEIYNSLDRALPYSFDARAYGKQTRFNMRINFINAISIAMVVIFVISVTSMMFILLSKISMISLGLLKTV